MAAICGGVVDPIVGVVTAGPAGATVGGITGACRAFRNVFKEVAKLDLPELGWVLIQRAMCRACGLLLSKSPLEKRKAVLGALKSVPDVIDEELANSNVIIDADFYENPRMEFSNRMQSRLEDKLIAIGFEEYYARNFVSSLPGNFVNQLRFEDRKGREDYQRLYDHVHERFSKPDRSEAQWAEYRSMMRVELQQPLFEESFSLSDVRQKIRCMERVPKREHSPDEQSNGASDPNTEHDGLTRKWSRTNEDQLLVHTLEDRLESWIEDLFNGNYSPSEAIKFVTGGPGAGKSTEVKFFADHVQQKRFDQGRKRLNVLVVPLHAITYKNDIEKSLSEFCILHEPPMPTNLLELGGPVNPLLLIFDGLDELTKAGKAGVSAAEELVAEVVDLVIKKGKARQLAILFCGRPISVSKSIEKRPEQSVFELLPYIIPEEDHKRYTSPTVNLKEDQRETWWKQFQTLKGRKPIGLPKELKANEQDLQELTSQPLLNYLVALSREDGFNFKGRFNRSELYRHMIGRVIEQPYQVRASPTHGLNTSQIVSLLETVALAAWNFGGRSVSLEQVKPYFINPEQATLLSQLASEQDQSLLLLFIEFYVYSRLLGSGQEVFEFVHKSFSEYLAVRKMIAEVHSVSQEWEKNQKDFQAGLSTRGALAKMGRLFGPTRLTVDLVRFFKDEFQACDANGELIYDDVSLARLRKLSVAMINEVSRFGMPMEEVKDGPREYVAMDEWAKHAEEVLFVLHETVTEGIASRMSNDKERDSYRKSICGDSKFNDRNELEVTYLDDDVTAVKESTRVVWPDRLYLGSRLKRLVGHRGQFDPLPILQSVSWLPLAECNLRQADLDGANLDGANLVRTNLGGANLVGADLGRAYLGGANLVGANLRSATVSMRALSMTAGKPLYLPDGSKPVDENWRETYCVVGDPDGES